MTVDEIIGLISQSDQLTDEELDDLAGTFEEKANAIVYAINEKKKDLASIDVDINAYKEAKAKQKAIQNSIDFLENKLSYMLIATGTDKLRTGKTVVSLKKPTYSTVVDNESEIPDEFKEAKLEYKVDKTAIKKAILETGEVIPGVHLQKKQGVKY